MFVQSCFWGGPVAKAVLHHVSIVTRDLTRSIVFYRDVLGLQLIDRPPFKVAGAWLAVGDSQIHLIENPNGTYRAAGIDGDDVHFALRVDDFTQFLAMLAEKGYGGDLPVDDERHVRVRPAGIAGFPQAFLLDPDRHLIEVNAAAAEAG
jgi:catechol 2,3-dioxygenase-like lactoylglutathione lyase family enzyme